MIFPTFVSRLSVCLYCLLFLFCFVNFWNGKIDVVNHISILYTHLHIGYTQINEHFILTVKNEEEEEEKYKVVWINK